MRITALRRGGLSVYGGSYDARQNCAIVNTQRRQTVEIAFPDPLDSVETATDGLSITTPVITGSVATFVMEGRGSAQIIGVSGNERIEVQIGAPGRQVPKAEPVAYDFAAYYDSLPGS